jgi:hypothetical protein
MNLIIEFCKFVKYKFYKKHQNYQIFLCTIALLEKKLYVNNLKTKLLRESRSKSVGDLNIFRVAMGFSDLSEQRPRVQNRFLTMKNHEGN